MFYTVLLVGHTIIVLFLIGLVLLQRPEGDGMGSLGGGGGNFLSGRSAGNALTRATSILAAVFIATSLILAIMAGRRSGGSITDQIVSEPAAVTGEAAEENAPKAEEKPASVPKPE